MDTKKYRVLEEAVSLGSFSKAGEALGYTQSAITQMMKILEHEIGFPLLNKSHQGVQLTPDGQKIMPAIRALLNSEEALQQEINFIKNIERGELKIGTFLSCSIHWLPEIIRTFQYDYPLISLDLFEAGDDELDQQLLDGQIDLAFSSQHGQSALDFIPISDDPIMAIVPPNHKYYNRSSIKLEEINDQPFILSEKSFDRDIHRIIRSHNLRPDVKFASQNGFAIISMVEYGLGISMLPSLILKNYSGKSHIIPLEPRQSRQLGILVRSTKNLSPAMGAFIKCSKKILLA
ncbi:MAG: LysR family transcriptional regulator [Lachnospiraceae bacterium]|nr:LysR family transcriptional regulator [Lachnospiraceae bacterium]